ncbi:hypothetical protein BaRGS_00019677 [Batillaria attramentaria]|uniref:Aminoglycoside phosphotransferase domain-containing protein n=1 Tax=Batillaria attramentaria TaxID=370345 RepID=A0ABD0KPD0_9CAEN
MYTTFSTGVNMSTTFSTGVNMSTTFSTGVIHGDFHSLNIIVDWEDQKVEQSVSGMSTASWDMATLVPQHPQLPHSRCTHQQIIRKYGIIDFEETSFSYPVLELSRLMADMMIDCQLVDVMDIGGHVIAGYMSVNSFTVKQFHYLYETALTCLAQYIILGTHEHQVQEGANVYVMIGVAPSLQVLDKLKGVSSKRVYRAWAAVLRAYNIDNPFPHDE